MNGQTNILDLKQAIQELWRNIFEVNYIKPIDLNVNDNLYTLRLVIGNVQEKPIYINIECKNDEEFLDKLTKELKQRHLEYSWYFTMINLTDCDERKQEF